MHALRRVLARSSMNGSRWMALSWALVACAGAALAPSSGFAQLVDIADGPLYGGRSAHPNVAVSLSVEFPTVGAAYIGIDYVPANAYLGYFDPAKCYVYDAGSGGHFAPAGNANALHECSDRFSGNFMNWATMSAIDEFRYAMTGGNRVDESGPNGGTIVQRAYLPDGSVTPISSFYANDSNFPRRALSPAFAATVLPASVAGAGATVNVTSCKTQVFFGTGGGGDCGTPDANRGTYNVRVNVCDAAEGPARADLCLQYGGANGKYKPVGEAQRNAARMRFSVFGYLMDRTPPAGCDDLGWNRCRYGGVLRAPMKYLGPTQFDASLAQSANAKTEINGDGTLVDDPEGTASSAGGTFSGFINYINKFGSNGVYKTFDTMGEMYYEAIRYYQNLGPTPAAADPSPSASLSPATKDFFPLTTTWTDPILSRCSANYIVSLSDANTWDDTYLPGYAGSPTAGFGRPSSRAVEGGLDAYDWTRRIGVLESSTASLTTDDVRPGLLGLENRITGSAVSPKASYLAAGAAYWANTNDIRADLVGKQTIKTVSFDVAEPSIDIHDRQLYLMGKYGGFNNTRDRPEDGTQQNPFWAADPAAPNGPAIRSNVEWQDGAGSPSDYLLASDPQKLINGLRAAFGRISSTTGTLSGASLTSANLTYGAADAYVATFDPVRWSGSVLSNSLSVDPNTGSLLVSPDPNWDSGSRLNARCGTVASGSTVCTDTDVSVDRRNIVTVKNVAGTRAAIDFTYANVATDPSYLLTLNTNPATNLPDNLAQRRVNYLRGYRGDEAGAIGFRARDSAMGDIINSGPVYVGPPSTGIPDADYQPFFDANSARTPAVYVGANDGMLHAIRASSGVELFAYIPGFAAAHLNDLTNPGYQHEAFVDTLPKVQEAKVGGAWKTVLVGANGNGAQGVFALDVTDPTAFGPTKVLFEFSDADDPDFGSVLAAPEIAKLRVGPAVGSPAVYKYFAVVTGYNNRRTDVNGHAAGDGNVSSDTLNKGVLFLLSLDHALNTPWVAGIDYYKFTFPATTVTSPNGLGPVTLLPSRSGDRSTAAMYFGDLQGNLWRFNTAGNDPSAWTPARGTLAAPLPIFVATDASSRRQPITARPELASGPFGSTLVFFGTGEYLGEPDKLSLAQQSEYALLDTGSSAIITRSSDLVQRTATLSGGNVTIAGSAFSYSGLSARKGWYVDFPSSASTGERSVTKPAVRTGLLTFTTQTLSSDVCGAGGGFIYQVNALTGLPYGGAQFGAYTSTVGIPGPPRIVDLTLQPGLVRATGEQINQKTQATLVSGTLSNKIAIPGGILSSKAPPVGRINWREITNWNDLTGN